MEERGLCEPQNVLCIANMPFQLWMGQKNDRDRNKENNNKD